MYLLDSILELVGVDWLPREWFVAWSAEPQWGKDNRALGIANCSKL